MPTFFEDFSAGQTEEFGAYDVTEEEILQFASQYDPQWFHTDPERAREESIYGGLIASGWHTTAMMMRMLVDEFLSETAALGAKGIDELRWRRPVRPGDTLSLRLTVVETEAEGPDRGLVKTRIEVLNDTEVVCSMIALTMFARRDDERDDCGN
ncbi:acyl dehydratase [Halogeometricum borinquense DSM 11551]|uniref:Acyl dehydratase n=1 Tax=Halogeometricum borinquense (strain ATCC 700274 / DSM 11551 / JCM 10706 / KCTC 4070 / PR3) TaxID=469382 RepID=E4NT18_HALBP|nr:MaoC family dehydratase [Halogeometricum borinquense]ADQ67011.1 acyl dehydratase [Halogeometricum borinquense DSM 11551]ELY29802.1 acyl dehydratase [Halogeometricum borinquense DSM 11551]